MNILITICARGGSKGVPNKNIKKLCGHPLISYSAKTASEFKKELNQYNIDIILSTDSLTIKNNAFKFGLSTKGYNRPSSLATDKAGKVDVIRDVLEYAEHIGKLRYDYVLDLDVTSPLRTINDLVESIELMENDKEALTLFSVSEAHRNPYFNMVELQKNGYATLVKSRSSVQNILSRQVAPKVFDMNASFYYYRRFFFEEKRSSPITHRSRIYLMKHICFDIDTLLDFDIMEYLIKENKLDFIL